MPTATEGQSITAAISVDDVEIEFVDDNEADALFDDAFDEIFGEAALTPKDKSSPASSSRSPPSIPIAVEDEGFACKVLQTAEACAEVMPTFKERLAAMNKKQRTKLEKQLASMSEHERLRYREKDDAEYARVWEAHKEHFSLTSVHLANLERNEVEAAAHRKEREQAEKRAAEQQVKAERERQAALRKAREAQEEAKGTKRKRTEDYGQHLDTSRPRAVPTAAYIDLTQDQVPPRPLIMPPQPLIMLPRPLAMPPQPFILQPQPLVMPPVPQMAHRVPSLQGMFANGLWYSYV